MSALSLRSRILPLAVLAALPLAALAAPDPEVAQLNQRLDALQADAQTADQARYEQLMARQAVATFANAKRRDLDDARYLAERRVDIAETTARTAVLRQQLDALEAKRSDLLLKASQLEVARARQEAERLRVQAQIQSEEAERLRQEAADEAQARQDAQQALDQAAGKQTARLGAAQRKAARLAREEAELESGAKLPPSNFDARGETFAFAAAAFSGSGLSASGKDQGKALAQYLQIGAKGKVRIEAYADDAATAQKRAQALKDALVAGGVAASRLSVSGKKGASKASVVVSP